MSIAKIDFGIVTQVDRTTDVAPPGWHVCGELVACGMLFDGVTFTAPSADPKRAILREIAALEATVTQRRMREAALTDQGKTWLAAVDAQIAALRVQL